MKQIGIIIIIFIFLFVACVCCIINKRKMKYKKESGPRKESIVYRDLDTIFKDKNNDTCLDDSKYNQFKEKLKNYEDDDLHHAIALISGELKALDVEAIKGAVYTVIFTSASFIVTEQLTTLMGGQTQMELLSNCMIVVFACLYMLGLLKDYTNKKWQEYFVQILRFELERRGKENNQIKIGKGKEMTEINSLEEYISVIKDIYAMEGCIGIPKIFYRGQSNYNFKLIPSLSHNLVGFEGDDNANYILYEKEIIERAKLEYPDIFSDNNSIDELALMQHYGLPTRLMDVTENPLVALYFACTKDMDYPGEVFIFNAGLEAEIYTSYDEKRMKKNNKIAFVRAKTFSNRQRVQQGLFMWFPDEKLKGIEKEAEKNPVIIQSVIIPAKKKDVLLYELEMVGISLKSIFPDNIDGCCKELVRDITKNAFSA